MTTDTATLDQIETLRFEAGQAGDHELVETCRRAERGDTAARGEVTRLLADERARRAEEEEESR